MYFDGFLKENKSILNFDNVTRNLSKSPVKKCIVIPYTDVNRLQLIFLLVILEVPKFAHTKNKFFDASLNILDNTVRNQQDFLLEFEIH